MGIEPINGGFANHCLTGWLPRHARWRVAKQLGQQRAGVKRWIARTSKKRAHGLNPKGANTTQRGIQRRQRMVEFGGGGAQRWQ